VSEGHTHAAGSPVPPGGAGGHGDAEQKHREPGYRIVTWRYFVRHEELGNWDAVIQAAELWWAGEHSIEYIEDLNTGATLDPKIWQDLGE
jgi:hypothetical protein